jgi:hypothetical protein
MSQLTSLAFFYSNPGRAQALGEAHSTLVDPPRTETELHQSLDDADVWFIYELALGSGPGGAQARTATAGLPERRA